MEVTLEYIRDNDLVFTETDLKEQPQVVKQMQLKLSQLYLYPSNMIDGLWGPRMQSAITNFCKDHNLNNYETGLYGQTFAKLLLAADADEPDISYVTVAKVLRVPVNNTQKHLPALISALRQEGIYSKRVLLATLATVGTEVPSFNPIREIGGRDYFTRMYEHRRDLGNCQQGDGARFCGRGWIQLTGRDNYRIFGQRVGIDLENYPERALEPGPAARILAIYFKDRGVHNAANAGNWRAVRKKINGGYNGWERFSELVTALAPYLT